MICPKCGMYNTYGRQECTECGHCFVPKPVELSADEEIAAKERESQPYYFVARDSEGEVIKNFSEKTKDGLAEIKEFIITLFKRSRKNKKLRRVLLVIVLVILAAIIALSASCVSSCNEARREREAALLASMTDVVEEDPMPSIASMSDVWVLNQLETKMTLNEDGTFTDDSGTGGGSGTWSYDEEKIYLIYSDNTLKNYTYQLIGDYLFLDWEQHDFIRDCNESETVEAAGLWVDGTGYAMALHEDGTHGTGTEEYGRYADVWVWENGILAMTTIRNNVEYFSYYGCEIEGETMTRLSGTVYVREGGGIQLGGGEIEFSSGYDPDA